MDLPAPGTRIRLVAMPQDPDPVPPGSEGTVLRCRDLQIEVDWDNGRRLFLLPDVDEWVELSPR